MTLVPLVVEEELKHEPDLSQLLQAVEVLRVQVQQQIQGPATVNVARLIVNGTAGQLSTPVLCLVEAGRKVVPDPWLLLQSAEAQHVEGRVPILRHVTHNAVQ